MSNGKKLKGKIVSGRRQAAFFTQIPWVQEQCLMKLGFKPFPGTLNIELLPESILEYESVQKNLHIEFLPPEPNACGAKVLPVSVEGQGAAIIIPDERVRVHGRKTLELLAPVSLKKTLDKTDGDRVIVTVERGWLLDDRKAWTDVSKI